MIDCKKFGFKEWDEVQKARLGGMVPVKNYPRPIRKFKLVYQSFNQSVEEVYFWLLQSLREDMGLPDVKKVTDIFTASEQSAFWGAAQQRLQIQQGQVSNYLATIGKLTKELFQIVRELRILDERKDLYDASYAEISSKSSVGARRMSQSAEIVLRGYWVDLKDGGVKSPGSVYGLATTLGYTALPDLFFAAPPLKKEEVDGYVDGLKFNLRIKDVLRKKLMAYVVWKDHTFKEVINRRNFTIKFLRQHYNSIQMYIDWVKPYLRNVKRLQQNFERTESEDLIGAFEGSFTEIEVVCYNSSSKVMPAVVMTVLFRTQPHMDFHQDGYQHKGPVHVGRSEIVLRGYTWTQEDLDNYIKLRDAETMEMLGSMDMSLKEAIEALGDDLRKYLKESGEKFPEDIRKEEDEKAAAKKKKEQMKSAAEPFMALFGGFKEIFQAFAPSREKKDKGKPTDWELARAHKSALTPLDAAIWNTYKNFKKAHRMITW
ncbi:hypothetical protein KY363_02270 [Candidatus Woesearchaeota archaeon]|nr:hypothetical protein [Candidatus Woesearchaeota archaeon]